MTEASWRDYIKDGEHYTVLAEYDDGSAVCMAGYAGGAAPGGAWSTLTLMEISASGHVTFMGYERVSTDDSLQEAKP